MHTREPEVFDMENDLNDAIDERRVAAQRTEGGSLSSHVPAALVKQNSADFPGTGSVDTIREILFGNKVREQEQRFARLEESFNKELKRLRDEFATRVDSLEQLVKVELERLSYRIQGDRKDLSGGIREVGEGLKEMARNLETAVTAMSDQYTKENREIRQRLHQQANEILDRLRQEHDAMAATLERVTAQLRDAKLDRDDLSALLAEMAMRVKRQFESSGLE